MEQVTRGAETEHPRQSLRLSGGDGVQWEKNAPNPKKRHKDFTLGVLYRQHLGMGPELERLARVVFYKDNQFVIQALGIPSFASSIMLPLPTFRSLIKRLRLVIRPNGCDWDIAEKLAVGGLGFDGLKWVQIVVVLDLEFVAMSVHTARGLRDFVRERSKNSAIHFACAGRVDVDVGADKTNMDETRTKLREVITFST
jgi:hypothetical protein